MRYNLVEQDSYLISLGEVIHQLRISRGMSQQDLADLAGVHRTYISDIERGARNLTVTTVCRITSSLNVPSTKLFRMVDDLCDRSANEKTQS